jgi:hypothetical protein
MKLRHRQYFLMGRIENFHITIEEPNSIGLGFLIHNMGKVVDDRDPLILWCALFLLWLLKSKQVVDVNSHLIRHR